MIAVIEYPEGATPLDPDELHGLRFKHITTRAELDELEQVNIESGSRWLARQRSKAILTDEFAILLHKRLFADVWGWAGLSAARERTLASTRPISGWNCAN